MTVAMIVVPFWPVIWTHSPQWLFESKPFWPGMAAKYVAERGAHAGDVLDGVGLAVLGAVVAAGGAVAVAVARGALTEVVPGEGSVAGVILQRALRGGAAAGPGAAAVPLAPAAPVVPPVPAVPVVPPRPAAPITPPVPAVPVVPPAACGAAAAVPRRARRAGQPPRARGAGRAAAARRPPVVPAPEPAPPFEPALPDVRRCRSPFRRSPALPDVPGAAGPSAAGGAGRSGRARIRFTDFAGPATHRQAHRQRTRPGQRNARDGEFGACKLLLAKGKREVKLMGYER